MHPLQWAPCGGSPAPGCAVHFVSISTETDFPNAPEGKDRLIGPRAGPFGDQLGWLKQDLARANANRDQVPWVIVYGHRPMYSSGGSDFPLHSRRQLREVMEDTFYEAGVDMFFAGHVHGCVHACLPRPALQ